MMMIMMMSFRSGMFRRRHQTLSRAVSKVDGFLMFSNVGGFVCHIVNIIIILYSIIFYRESTATPVSVIAHVFWMSINIKGLLFSATAAILVNHMVGEPLCMCCDIPLKYAQEISNLCEKKPVQDACGSSCKFLYKRVRKRAAFYSVQEQVRMYYGSGTDVLRPCIKIAA